MWITFQKLLHSDRPQNHIMTDQLLHTDRQTITF